MMVLRMPNGDLKARVSTMRVRAALEPVICVLS